MNTKHNRALVGDGSDLYAKQPFLTDAERDAVRPHKVRWAERAKKGADWDGKADNDNIAWPLAKALLAEGNKELLKYALAYRRIYDQAKSDAVLGGKSVSVGGDIAIDRYSYISPSGVVSYRHPRKRSAADVDIPAKKYVVPPTYERLPGDAEEVKVSNWTNIPKPWSGDRAVNDMIDAKDKLAALQIRLGAILEPFEMAVVDSATLREVGNAAGVANRGGAMAAGRALVHMGLIAIRDALGELRREDIANRG